MDIINTTILRSSYDKMKSIKNWYNSAFNTHTTYVKLFDYIIDEFIKFKKLDYIDNIKDSDISWYSAEAKLYRIDATITPDVKEQLDAIKESIGDKKTINEVEKIIIMEYLEHHPEVNKILEKNRSIKQKILIEKAKENGIQPQKLEITK